MTGPCFFSQGWLQDADGFALFADRRFRGLYADREAVDPDILHSAGRSICFVFAAKKQMMAIGCTRLSAEHEDSNARSLALRKQTLDQHETIRRETDAPGKHAIVFRHFLCKGHAGLGRTLSAVDLWQESVDFDSIRSHVLL